MESGADLEHRGDPSVQAYRAFRRGGYAGYELEKRRFSGSVMPDNTDSFSAFDVERNAFQRPEYLAVSAAF